MSLRSDLWAAYAICEKQDIFDWWSDQCIALQGRYSCQYMDLLDKLLLNFVEIVKIDSADHSFQSS